MIVAFVTATALAAPPAQLRPTVAPVDVQTQFDAWAQTAGAAPATLACEPLWEGSAHLCFRVWEGGVRRWVTRSDLAGWGVTTTALRARAAAAAPAFLEAHLQRREVGGMDASYWIATDGDGQVAGVLLDPAALARHVGSPLRAACPAQGVLIAWKVPSDPDVDRAMAVGVRELHDGQPGSVSPSIFTWDGERWTRFGHAEPR